MSADTTPPDILDHDFEPKDEWWGLCGYQYDDGQVCNLSEAAHKTTTVRGNRR